MKIISKFSDYYDSVQGVMYDDSILYIRHNEHIVIDMVLPYVKLEMYSRIHYIGFCGKVYPVLRTWNIDLNNVINRLSDRALAYFSSKKLYRQQCQKYSNSYASYDFDEILPIVLSNKSYYHRRGLKYKWSKPDVRRAKSKVEEFAVYLESLDLFDKYKTPIFSITDDIQHRESELTINPILKDFNFQHVMDPYTTYQELVMWIGNQTTNETAPQITDDKIMRDKKGFDKWSFKTKPTKRKRK